MSANRPSPAACSIIVVEDEYLVRELAVCELEDSGFQVTEFATADEAFAHLCDGHASEAAVIFTDIQMPGRLNGLDLAAMVGRAWPDLPVLVTSGGHTLDPAHLPSSASFVAKPWRGADIVRRITALCVERGLTFAAPIGIARPA